jgi:hypothetical protein
MSKRAISVVQAAAILGILLGIAAHPVYSQTMCGNGCVTTYAYDNSRDNVNVHEQLFKASTISPTLTVDSVSNLKGIIYAQPLFVSNMTINSTVYDVLFVATEENWVYALDANHVSNTPLWSINLNNTIPGTADSPVPYTKLPGLGTCQTIFPEVGITGTPVIDVGSRSNLPNVLYVVSKHYNANGNPTITQRLNAIDIFTGARAGQAVDIATLYSGFSAFEQNQRAALALQYDSNNDPLIYVAWGSHCDTGTYSGKVAVFEATGTSPNISLALNGTFDTTGGLSGASQGGIWMGGAGPAIDDVGGLHATSYDVFLTSGNGTFQYNSTGASALGESAIRLHATSTSLTAMGNYTPYEWQILNNGSAQGMNPCANNLQLPAPYNPGDYLCTMNDLDLDAGGNILARPTDPAHMLPSTDNFADLIGGKEGVFYVVSPHILATVRDRDTAAPCGSYALQCFGAITLPVYDNSPNPASDDTGSRCGPAFWSGTSTYQQNVLYVAGSQDSKIRSYQMATSGNNANFGTTLYGYANAPNPDSQGNIGYPGNCPVVTWNASMDANTDALLWILDTSGFMTAAPAQLFGYQAVPPSLGAKFNLKTSDTTNGPGAIKFSVPTIVDGHVFAAGGLQVTVGTTKEVCPAPPCYGQVVSWH